jgi:leader peptidase (prepilin peptidase)/N-methyltransferase
MGAFANALPFWYQLVSAIILGAIWGSFVAALCSRWPNGESITNGRSRCDHCDTQLAAADLVPIFSYAWLRGKCRYCAQPIGGSALYIEIAAAVIGAISALGLDGYQAFAAAVFGWLLLPLGVLDYQRLWLPNRLVLLLALAGALMGPPLMPELSWVDRVAGGLFGYLALEGARQAFKSLRKKEGMGGGDPKLFGALGIWMGWQALPYMLLLSCVIGFAWVLLSTKTDRIGATHLPFGSFLCAAAFALCFWI